MDEQTVICPNCDGKDSSKWPFGVCKICNGTGITTPEKADKVISTREAYRKAHGK
jgi:DnaJ-class molecular chaperone